MESFGCRANAHFSQQRTRAKGGWLFWLPFRRGRRGLPSAFAPAKRDHLPRHRPPISPCRPIISTSISWYECEGDYSAILAMLPIDESQMAIGYADYISLIQGQEVNLAHMGFLPRRIVIKPTAFKEWCELEGMPVDRKSISTYTTKMLNGRISSARKN